MNVFLTALPGAADDATFLERITEAGIYALLGMLVIFLVLGVLLIILTIFNKIFVSKQNLDKIFDDESDEEEKSSSDDEATVAAITAAVAMLLESEAQAQNKTPNPFRVVAFRRTSNRAWNEKNNNN